MSRQERYGTRSLAYSQWHRTLDDALSCIDVDGCEFCSACREPLALIEAVRDVGQQPERTKATTVLVRLALRADLPAVLLCYTTSDDAGQVLDEVRAYSLPHRTLIAGTADGVAAWLRRLRHDHRRNGCERAA